MYVLTLLQSKSIVKTVEFHQPPTTLQIEAELQATPGADSFDISRKPLEDWDFEEYEDGLEEI